jgi:hypothetical protein
VSNLEIRIEPEQILIIKGWDKTSNLYPRRIGDTKRTGSKLKPTVQYVSLLISGRLVSLLENIMRLLLVEGYTYIHVKDFFHYIKQKQNAGVIVGLSYR